MTFNVATLPSIEKINTYHLYTYLSFAHLVMH